MTFLVMQLVYLALRGGKPVGLASPGGTASFSPLIKTASVESKAWHVDGGLFGILMIKISIIDWT